MNDHTNSSAPTDGSSDPHGESSYAPTILGWAARIISLSLVAGLAGIIAWQISLEERDIAFTVEVQSNKARKQGEQYLTPVDITNTGSATARMVNLEISTGAKPQEIEIALIGQNETVSYVIATDGPLSQAGHRIVNYEAP